MPAVEYTDRNQRALLWRRSGNDAYARQIVALESEEIWVIWDSKKTEMRAPDGKKINVDGQITTITDIEIGSIVWEGGLEDLRDSLPGTGTGTSTFDIPLTELFEVVAFDASYDLKGRVQARIAGIKRYSDTMPTQA